MNIFKFCSVPLLEKGDENMNMTELVCACAPGHMSFLIAGQGLGLVALERASGLLPWEPLLVF